jgi:hypothetical protein
MNKRGKNNFKNLNYIPPNNIQYNYNYINPNSIQPPNPNFYYPYYQNNNENFNVYNNNNNNNNINNPYYQDYSAQQKYNDQYNFHQINYYHGEEARNSYENISPSPTSSPGSYSLEEKLRNLTLNKTANDYIPKNKNKNNADNNNNHNNNSFNSINSKNYSGLDDELIANDETDREIWIPKYRNCECCEGFVYKCKGIACESMGCCYCKFTDEMNEFN